MYKNIHDFQSLEGEKCLGVQILGLDSWRIMRKWNKTCDHWMQYMQIHDSLLFAKHGLQWIFFMRNPRISSHKKNKGILWVE